MNRPVLLGPAGCSAAPVLRESGQREVFAG